MKSASSTKVSGRSLTFRSRVTNGSALLDDVDGRSTWARRFRDLIELHVNDKGGESNISEAEKALIRRAACLMVELERLEARFANAGGAKSWQLIDYGRTANTLRRLLECLGIERRARDITPSGDLTARAIDLVRQSARRLP